MQKAGHEKGKTPVPDGIILQRLSLLLTWKNFIFFYTLRVESDVTPGLLVSLVTVDKGRPGRAGRIISRILLFGEDLIKKPLFRCQQCGECILSHTAFICSQRCPKRLRNGPCGGTRDGGRCEVFPERTCVWYAIYRRSRLLRRGVLLDAVEPMHNWRLEKSSAWFNVFTRRIGPPVLFLRKQNDDDTRGKN